MAERDRMLTGMFRDRDSAERAYESLTSRGYSQDDVDLLMSDEARRRHFGDGPDTELGTKAAEGAGVGAAVGGGLGAVLAVLAAAGTIALPGIGLIAMGPIAAALTGGAIGATGGGILGALVGYGIPEEQARRYESGLREGHIVMGVSHDPTKTLGTSSTSGETPEARTFTARLDAGRRSDYDSRDSR
jgi:hypothetical protein